MRLIGSTVGRRLGLGGGILAAMMAVIAILAFGASAKSSSDDVLQLAKTEHVVEHAGTKTEPVAVNSKGKAVYELLPETTTKLLCTGKCLTFWFPVTVKSRSDLSAATGIKGKLGAFMRKGTLQVTLNGHPLYTFIEDTKKGTAHGDNVHGFGGVWHLFQEGSATSSSAPPTTTTTTTGMTPPPPAPPY
jgi:predicted lipoprotein with Yx(FWY)xxD motif